MKRLLVFLMFCMLSGYPVTAQPAADLDLNWPVAVTPGSVGMSSDRLERLHSVMQQYVDNQRIAGIVTFIARRGRIVELKSYGKLDLKAGTPMPANAIFRIASMTKAITSVGVMLLHEEGLLLLDDRVSKFIPEFKKTRVAASSEGASGDYGSIPARREITVRDLLTHTAGVSYGQGNPAEAEYKTARVHGWYFAGHDEPIGEAIQRLARLPFDAHPGEKWVYGFSTDVLGYLIERVSGEPLDRFFSERIFGPLGMSDTHFYVPDSKLDRFTPVYAPGETGSLKLAEDPLQSDYVKGPRKCFSGGAGLLSTALDYARFLQMLLNGGVLGGVRLLSPKTVELMHQNHVGDLYGNMGFGLGFDVVEHLGRYGQLGSTGNYGWGGAYYTKFWIDPEEEMIAVFMSQLLPSGGLDLQKKFQALVYQAIVD